ncbi:MAG: glycerophosphodiester phosphodiesterase, partial [Lachnospiraceae bacterium]|nr:glycerophosphodiester phosphodiesterase [Lachnospiraceae bacterium]
MIAYLLPMLGVWLLLTVLYLWMVMPRMWNRPGKEPFMGVLYAHRGLFDHSAGIPENSLAAFRRAVDAGYGIELDVQLTADGVPVVFHDGTLARMVRGKCGEEKGSVAERPKEGASSADLLQTSEVPGRVLDYTLKELKQFHLLDSEEKIPTFAEVLDLVNGKVPLIVELKAETLDFSLCEKADALLREYGKKGIYCIESFQPLYVCWFRFRHPEVFRGQLSTSFQDPASQIGARIFHFFVKYLLCNFLTRPDFIAYNYRCRNN